jgi:hypothetical protein
MAAARLDMPPSTFRTHSLGVTGTPTAAVRVAPARPWPVRLSVRGPTGGQLAFLAAAQAELQMSTAPAGAFRLGPEVIVFALAEHQALYAAGDLAGTVISVAVSQIIPPIRLTLDERAEGFAATFRTHNLRALGSRDVVTIASADRRPLRVVLEHGAAGNIALVSDASDELTNPGGAQRGFAYNVGAFETHVLVVAPYQSLYAAAVTAGLQMSVSVCPIVGVVGPTGIPGPDGQE